MKFGTKHVSRVAAAVAAAALSVGLVAAPASAATACERFTDVGFTIRDGDYVKGSGSGNTCGGELWVVIERKRAWPINWEPVGTPGRSSGAPVSAVFNCNGTGTFNYRTHVFIKVGRQYVNHKFSGEPRITC